MKSLVPRLRTGRSPLPLPGAWCAAAVIVANTGLSLLVGGCGGEQDAPVAESVAQVAPQAAAAPGGTQTPATAAAQAAPERPQPAPANSMSRTAPQGGDEAASMVTFDPPMMDFGTVPPDQDLTGQITLHNTGSKPVTIVTMKPSCKCTTVEDLSGTTLAPGETRVVNTKMEKRSYPGPRKSKIDFVFDDGSLVTYEIQSLVTMAIEAIPSYISALDHLSGEYVVRARDGKPFRILAINEREPVYVDGFDPQRHEPRDEYHLAWNMSGYDLTNCLDDQGNPVRLWWAVETDRPDVPVLDIRVRHDPCTRLETPTPGQKWFLADNRVLAGLIKPGESAEVEVTLNWVHHKVNPQTKIVSVQTDDDPQIHAELVEVTGEGEDMTIRIRVTPLANVTGLIYDEVRVISNVRGQNRPLTIIGRVDTSS